MPHVERRFFLLLLRLQNTMKTHCKLAGPDSPMRLQKWPHSHRGTNETVIFNSVSDRFTLVVAIWPWVNNAVIAESQAAFPLAPYMASATHPCTVWRGDSWCRRFTPALLPVWPQLSSQPLGRILFPGETECRLEERTCSFFSLSPGLNYDFPSKYEPGETAWAAIHQPTCLHPPEQCATLRAQWRSAERLLPPSLAALGSSKSSTSTESFKNNCMRWQD